MGQLCTVRTLNLRTVLNLLKGTPKTDVIRVLLLIMKTPMAFSISYNMVLKSIILWSLQRKNSKVEVKLI